MRLLLDTHVLLWWLDASPRLSERARQAIGDAGNDVLVSIATAWEVAIKRGLGRLSTPDDIEVALKAQNFALLPIGLAHVRAVERLPHHHRDPFDRMLVAQAIAEGLPLVTADPLIARYGARLLW